MRALSILVVVGVAGCSSPVPVVALAAAEGASVAVFGRGLVDIGVSAVTGRDCSIVRLDRRQTYCTPIPEPIAERYCTRSLARPDCWAGPAQANGIADTPEATAAQERYRLARWPKSLFAD